ncbi:MAG TPA: pectinesterase family protein [Allosphingosinicella sp.]
MVGPNGSHATLGAALAAAPAGSAPYRILLERGEWEERVVVRRPNIRLTGAGAGVTILHASTSAGDSKPGGGTWGTYGSGTLTVEAPGFQARRMTIANRFDYLARLAAGASNTQAVALVLGDAADMSLIDQVEIVGHQDSFYLRAGRALVRDSLISGSIDFIFGGALAWFRRCELRSRLRPGQAVQGYVAAPSTPRVQPLGLVFDQCRLTREPGVADHSVFLGRPWRAGGDLSRTGAAAYLDCWMDSHIGPSGWAPMGYRGRGGYPMVMEPGDGRFFEWSSRGPGAGRHPSRPQLGGREARDIRRRLAASLAGAEH